MGIVYDKFRGAWLDRDAETYMSCLHTEYEFHLHSNGRKITIANYDVDRILNFMTESEQLHPTCIYENEEILVEHFYTVATDGSCEAVLWSHKLKDGLIWRSQNGCTSLTKEQWNAHPLNQ